MENQVYKALETLNIQYTVIEHDPFFTCEESAEFAQENPGGHAKTLFLRDKKKKNYFVAVVAAHHRVDTKALCTDLQCSGGKLSFGSAEDLQTVLKITPGSVNPFSLLFDTNNIIKNVLIDESLSSFKYVYFHPMRNTASVKILFQDFQKFLQSLPHQTQLYRFE